MERRNFIKTTGVVCTLSGAFGGNIIWNFMIGIPSIQFPKDFKDKGKSHIVKLYKDIKKDHDFDPNKEKWIKRMLEPKKVLEQKDFSGGGYNISFINKLGNTVRITSVGGKTQTRFS